MACRLVLFFCKIEVDLKGAKTMADVNQLFIKEYGFNDGLRMAGIVYKNIEKDFISTLKDMPVGATAKEEYRFDDRAGAITLWGEKSQDGSCRVTRLSFDGKTIYDL